MTVFADLLLVLGCLPMLLLTFTAKRSGPEGPVGAHMITGPLAASFQAVLVDQCERWEVTLRDDRNAGTWYYNLVHYFTIAERIAADGGDVREGMRQWGERLRGKHGLGELRSRAEKLAAG